MLIRRTNPPVGFLVPHHVERWYDRNTRSWIVQTMDVHGNQIADADYCGTRSQATRCEALRLAEIQGE